MSLRELTGEQEMAAGAAPPTTAGAWDLEEEGRWRLHQELIEAFGSAPQETTSGWEDSGVETAPPEGVASPPSIDPAMLTKENSQEGAKHGAQEDLVVTHRIHTVVWARQQFTLAACQRSAADEDLLSRGMAALSLDPGMLLYEVIEDRHHVSRIGVSSADYVESPARPHEFILELEALNEVPVFVTVADLVRSVKSPLKLKPPDVLSLDFLGAQVGKAQTDAEGRRVTANRRFMDDNRTPVMSILVAVSADEVELRQKVGDAPAFTQGAFPRRVATPRLERQVWGPPTTAPAINSQESRPERSPPEDAPEAKRPRRAVEDDRPAGSVDVTAGAQQTAQRALAAEQGRVTGRLTADEAQTIKARMGEDTPSAIAEALNRGRETVRGAIERFRAEAAGGRATGPLTADEEQTIKDRMDEDTPAAIARDLNREVSTVRMAINRFRAEAAGGRATGPLTAEEEQTIRDRMDEDTPTAIATDLNRGVSTVGNAITRFRAKADGARTTGRLTAREEQTIRDRMERDRPANIATDLNRAETTVRKAIDRFRAEARGARTGRLTEEEEQTIKDRMDKDTPTAIARDLNRAETTVHDAIDRFRAEAAGGRASGRLTTDEKQTIEARMDKDTPAAIAKDLNRAETTVHDAIVRLRAEAAGARASGPLTAQEAQTIKDRMDEDTQAAIAKDLNREETTVRRAIERLRAKADGARTTGRLTAREEQTIKDCMDENTPTAIAKDLNRAESTVRTAIQRFRAEAAGGSDQGWSENTARLGPAGGSAEG